jgi:hypothetical protein
LYDGERRDTQSTMPALTEEQQRRMDEAVAKIKGQISLTGL